MNCWRKYPSVCATEVDFLQLKTKGPHPLPGNRIIIILEVIIPFIFYRLLITYFLYFTSLTILSHSEVLNNGRITVLHELNPEMKSIPPIH